jgi:hypothetical protein
LGLLVRSVGMRVRGCYERGLLVDSILYDTPHFS